MHTAKHAGNLSGNERTWSASIGTALLMTALRRGSPIFSVLAGLTGLGLLARAAAGHCAVKAAMTGTTSLGEAVRDQWNEMSGRDRGDRHSGAGQSRYAQSQYAQSRSESGRSGQVPYDTQEAVEERATPEAVEEGYAGSGRSAPGPVR